MDDLVTDKSSIRDIHNEEFFPFYHLIPSDRSGMVVQFGSLWKMTL